MKIVITGCSSGIGLYLTERFLKEGHQVAGLSRRKPSHLGGEFHWVECDVSEWHEVHRAAAEVKSNWGHCDAIVCCAGIQGAMGPSMEVDPLEWARTVRVNLDGTYFSIRAFFELLKHTKVARAKVICFSGGGSTAPRPLFSAYGASKTGVVRLVETLAHEWKNERVDINSIAPGAIATAMMKELVSLGPDKVGKKEYDQAVKLLSEGSAEKSMERAFALVQFLVSPKSDQISGRLLSAVWDKWEQLERPFQVESELYTLRRVTPPEAK